jgi:hypothetical protein
MMVCGLERFSNLVLSDSRFEMLWNGYSEVIDSEAVLINIGWNIHNIL